MAGTKLLTQLSFLMSLLAVVPVAYRLSAIERQLLPRELLPRLRTDIEATVVAAALRSIATDGNDDLLADRSAYLALKQDVDRIRATQSYMPAAELHMTVTLVVPTTTSGNSNGADGNDDASRKKSAAMKEKIAALIGKLADIVPTHIVFQLQTAEMTGMQGRAKVQDGVIVVGLPQLQKCVRVSRSAVRIGQREMQLFVVVPPAGNVWDVESDDGEQIDYASLGNKTIIAGYWSPSEGLYLIANEGVDTPTKVARFLSNNLLQIYGIGAQVYDQLEPVVIRTSSGDFEIPNIQKWNAVVQQVAYSLDMYASAVDALEATSVLVHDTPHMTVTVDIADRFKQSVQLLLSFSQPGQSFRQMFEAIRRGFELAQSTHYDPSMLPTMYFPLDQLFAIYAPFWLPLLAPLLAGTITQVKKYRQAKPPQEATGQALGLKTD